MEKKEKGKKTMSLTRFEPPKREKGNEERGKETGTEHTEMKKKRGRAADACVLVLVDG